MKSNKTEGKYDSVPGISSVAKEFYENMSEISIVMDEVEREGGGDDALFSTAMDEEWISSDSIVVLADWA